MGTPATTTQFVVDGAKATQPADPTRDGYTFGGWYKETTCTTAWLFSTPVKGNMTLYAKWTANTTEPDPGPDHDNDYSVIYEPNYTGAPAPRMDSYDSGRQATVRDNDWFQRDGWTFQSWNERPDGSGTRYLPGDTFKMPSRNVHLYAQWARTVADPDDTGVSDWLDTSDHRLYLVGYPDQTFGPDRNMTRAEVAQMFYALLREKDVSSSVGFSDVADGLWYSDAVHTLAALGMVEGYPDGTFRPDRTITRAEFTTIAMNFTRGTAKGSNVFSDVAGGAWYYDFVVGSTKYGWIGGYPDGTFRPDRTITRAEVAVIVNNMLGRAADQDFVDRNVDDLITFPDTTRSHWAYYAVMEATNSHDYTKTGGAERWTR